MTTLSKTLRLFLDSIGRREEYEFYLKKFQADRSVCFALVAPETAAVEQSGDLMTFDLQFLLRLELTPLVVLAGPDAVQNAASLSAYGDYTVLSGVQVGDPEVVWRARLRSAVAAGKIPIWLQPQSGLEETGRQLCPRIARRIHLLRVEGMLHDGQGEPIFYHYTRRRNPHEISAAAQAWIRVAEQWLAHDPQLHISIASPLHLLQEMFTVRGMGSTVRPGSMIHHHAGVSEADLPGLARLMAEAFGRPLVDPARLLKASDLYVEERCRGAVLLETHPAGKYLSKFAVGTEARGEGLAQELWEVACAPQPALFWRSRSSNPINQWYERQADGRHREGHWTVFWRGVPAVQLAGVIGDCLARPEDFVAPPR